MPHCEFMESDSVPARYPVRAGFRTLGMVVTGKPLSPDRGFVVSKAISCYNQTMYKYHALRSNPIASWQMDDAAPFDDRAGFDYNATVDGTPDRAAPLVNGAKFSTVLSSSAVASFDCPVFKKGLERRPFALESWVLPVPKSVDMEPQPYRENLAERPCPVPGVSTTEGPRWALSGDYWGAESTRSIETSGGPFNRAFLRKTITNLAHATTNGTIVLSSNPDVGNPVGNRGAPVVAGKTYTISVYVRYSTTTTAERLVYSFADESGTKLNTNSGPWQTITPNKWSRISITVTAPVGATKLLMRTGTSSTSVIGSTYDASCLMVTEGEELKPYGDGDTPGWEWLGTTGDSTSRTRSDVSKVNYALGPLPASGNGWGGSWGTGGAGTSGIVPSGGPNNWPFYRMTWTTLPTAGQARVNGPSGPHGSVREGDVVVASMWAWSNVDTTVNAYIDIQNSSGAYIAGKQTPHPIKANTWTRISATMTAPAEASKFTLFVSRVSPITIAVGDQLAATGMMFEVGRNTPSEFFYGTMDDSIWADTTNNSPSYLLVSSGAQQILSHAGRFDGLSIDGKTVSFNMEFANQPPVQVTYNLSENQLAHVVGVFSGNSIELWVNGKSVASTPLTEEQKFDSYLDADGKLYSGFTTSSQRLAVNGVAVYNTISAEDIEKNYRAGIETIGQAKIPVQKSGVPIELSSGAGAIFHEEEWTSNADFSRGLLQNVQAGPDFVVPSYVDDISVAGSWSMGFPLDSLGHESIYGVALSWAGTNIKVETSLDGSTWLPAKNGELVPVITPGMNPAGEGLEFRVLFEGGKTEDPARLDSISAVAYANNTISNITLNSITLSHPALVRDDHEARLYRDDNGVFLGGGAMSIVPDSAEDAEPVRGIELWIKPRTGIVNITGVTGTRYRNGVVDSTLPTGEWSLVHIVSADPIASTVKIEGDAIIGQMALYDLALSASDVSHIWKSYGGTTAFRVEEANIISLSEQTMPVNTYSHDWSISQAG